jgi:hypothetical protein
MAGERGEERVLRCAQRDIFLGLVAASGVWGAKQVLRCARDDSFLGSGPRYLEGGRILRGWRSFRGVGVWWRWLDFWW